RPVSLHIDAPSSNGDLALLSESGWPITIKMNVELPAGSEFPAYAVQPNFPTRGDWGFLIFDDPDGCLNPPAPSWLVTPSVECGVPDPLPMDWDWEAWVPPESDEVYMEFWADVDMAGVEDFAGNEDRQADLVDAASSGGPEFESWSEGNVQPCVPDSGDPGCDKFGPNTGGEVVDGFGIAADDDLPGLVLIAEYGIGRTYNEPLFEITDPIGARNLAGLINSVSYDLSDLEKSKGRPPRSITEFSRIWAHVNMLPLVMRHIIQYDACVGEVTYQTGSPPFPESCAGDELWRVDGGPIETAPMNYTRGDAASIDLLESTVFEVRAFLVAGQAPNELYDENGDGVVDSEDAVAAGYQLLSNEDSIEFLQLSNVICWGGGGSVVDFDLDGNGETVVPIVCPGGPGGLGRPPR
ncbi:MAG: hypothetical protein R3212_04145, partial [Xanthomonadales bacterium]|nr:hypothetical protein [Xanthomonadales bacterium]